MNAEVAITNSFDTVNNCLAVKQSGGRVATAHRTGITAVDKVTVGTITAADQPAVAGVMAAVEHKVAYAPGNAYGTAGASAIVAVTPTLNKSVDITMPQATGATYYDVFFSTDAAPKWVGRVTEAQRAAGCAITAVGTIDPEGGTEGIVNVRLVGTGIATTNAVFAQNNAYTPDTVAAVGSVDCTGKTKAYVHVQVTLTDLRSAPSLNIVPFLKNAAGVYYQGQMQSVLLLAGLGQSLRQVFEVDVDAADEMVVLVGTIAGQGASVAIQVETF
jgi:hypothetical protein